MHKSPLDLLFLGGHATWQSPEMVSFRRLPSRSPLVPYPSVESACTYSREKTPWLLSLNGEWDFTLLHRPEDVAAEMVATDFNPKANGFRKIPVPSNWTLQDTFDRPHYTNVQMPFPEEPPQVPKENPTGVYRTHFTVPAKWKGRRIALHVGGAESVLYVWVNENPIGLSKDTRLPSEFDITEFVQPGRTNTLAAVVVKWSDATFIEDQDQWWMGGIFREVFLYTTGPVFLQDVFCRAGLDSKYRNGKLDLSVKLGFAPSTSHAGEWTVEARLFYQRKPVFKKPLQQKINLTRGNWNRYRAHFEIAEIQNIQAWSAEAPHLYTVVISLLDAAGHCVEATSLRTGFRTVETRNRNLLINGKRVFIKGVNRHEHDDRTGKALSFESMLRDIHLIKQFNFNAVRCAHYPNHIRWCGLQSRTRHQAPVGFIAVILGRSHFV